MVFAPERSVSWGFDHWTPWDVYPVCDGRYRITHSNELGVMTGSLSEDQLRALIEYSSDTIIAVDDTGTISFVSPAVKDMLGYEPEEMVGTNAFQYIHAEDRGAVLERFTDLLETDGTTTDRVQHRMVHRDGRVIWAESIGSNRASVETDDIYVINTRNINELKVYESELKRQNERLDEFASVVSHDSGTRLITAERRPRSP